MHPLYAFRARLSDDRQISPATNGFVIRHWDASVQLGVLRVDPVGPPGPGQTWQDRWFWSQGVAPWPDRFRLFLSPILLSPPGAPEVWPAERFLGAEALVEVPSGAIVYRILGPWSGQGTPPLVGWLRREVDGAGATTGMRWYKVHDPQAPPSEWLPDPTESLWLQVERVDPASLPVPPFAGWEGTGGAP